MILEHDDLLARAERGVERAEAQGADQAEVYLWSAKASKASRAGRLRDLEAVENGGASVRAWVDGRLASSVGSGLQDVDIGRVADRAVTAARLVPKQPTFQGFAPVTPIPSEPTPVDKALVDPDPDRLLAMADTLAGTVQARSEIEYHDAGSVTHFGRFAVVNSRGQAAWDHNAFEVARLEVRAHGGGSQRFAVNGLADRHPLDTVTDLEAMAEATAELAATAVHGARLDASVDRVLFDPQTALEVITRVLPSFGGRGAARGRSRFADRLNQQVASEVLTLRDEPRGPDGCRNQRVDDEGIPTENRTLVDRGVLQAFLYDWSSSVELDEAPTGHGLRPDVGRHKGNVGTRVPNMAVEPGTWSLEEMVEAAGQAVLVRGSLMGSFTMNAATGDFSLTAPLAFHVEDGEVKTPLVPAMLAGNLFEAIESIQAVGRDVTCFRGGATPSLWIDGITCTT